MKKCSKFRKALLSTTRYSNKHCIASRLVQYSSDSANVVYCVFKKDEIHILSCIYQVIFLDL